MYATVDWLAGRENNLRNLTCCFVIAILLCTAAVLSANTDYYTGYAQHNCRGDRVSVKSLEELTTGSYLSYVRNDEPNTCHRVDEIVIETGENGTTTYTSPDGRFSKTASGTIGQWRK